MSSTNNLRTRIADELARQASDVVGANSLTLGTVINREINAAIRHYESTRFRWNEVRESTMFTMSSGTRTYSLPPDFIRADTIKISYNGDYVKLKRRTWDWFEETDRDVSGADGIPSNYTIYGNIVRVYPVPNQTLTCIGSYVRRFPPTSLTGSYTAVVPVGGGQSLTVTSTASHHSRIDGWTTDGETLIRARAKASVRIRYFRDEQTIAEARGMALNGKTFLSVEEQQAYQSLSDETADFLATGTVKPYCV